MNTKTYLKSIIFVFCIFMYAFANDATQTKDHTILLNHKTFTNVFNSIDTLNQITWQLQTADSNQKDSLLKQKNELLSLLLTNIKDTRQSLGLDLSTLRELSAELQHELANTATKNHHLQSEITQNSLMINQELLILFQNLRKQIDFFSHKQEVLDIIKPTLTNLTTLPNSFNFLQIPKNTPQEENIKLQAQQYYNQLTTAIELVKYLEKYSAEFVPQNTILHTAMRFVLKQIANSTHFINHENMFIVKIILSIICFGVLWAFRQLLTKFVLYLMNFSLHLTSQNQELRARIQASLLQPISLFLLVWSMRVCVGVVYYPELPPEKFDVWFIILYIINFAWFTLILAKSYGVVLLTNILQKSNDGFRKEILNLILKIIYSIIVIIALLAILKCLGFNISAIIASLGLGGLAVALAIKDMLANFFASVMLLLDNSFSQGDWIECGGVEGTVVEIGLRRTTIRTFENALLFVPNSDLAGKTIRNWSRRKAGRRMKMSVGLTYNSSEEKLKKCVEDIKAMLSNHPKIALTPKYDTDELHLMTLQKDIVSIDDYLGYKTGISVCVEALGDSSINILVDCFTESVGKADFYAVREEIIFNIMQIVKNCDLSFAFPSQSIYVETLPQNPKDSSMQENAI